MNDFKSQLKNLRNALKNQFNASSRVVSVKQSNGSLCRGVDITIKKLLVKGEILDVQGIKSECDKLSQVRRCPYSGDILGGGNTYVHVSVEQKALENLTEELDLEKKLEALKDQDILLVGGVEIHKEADQWFVCTSEGGGMKRGTHFYDTYSASLNAARRIVNG